MSTALRRSLLFSGIGVTIAAVISAQAPAPALQSDWYTNGQSWAGTVRSAGLSVEGRCVAITTSSFVAVIDKAGRELWRWNFSEGNRFIVANRVAVAPRCDWLTFTGDVGYRYAWVVHRSGKRIAIRTEGTPLSVEINHAGTLAATGTGAGAVYLLAADGTLRWKMDIGGGLVPVEELSFADDDSAIMVRSRGQSVISIAGKTQWSGGVWGVGSGRSARDFKTFVAWGEPPHGPGIGVLALLDSAGKTLWQRYATIPVAIISSAGDLVVARTNDNQNPTEEDGFLPRKEELAGALRLIAADGHVVRTFSTPGEPVSFADDGRRFLVNTGSDFLALDIEGNALWSIPSPDRFAVTVLTTPDLHNVVVLSNGNLEWFSPK
jgi:hypothetical protein